MVFLRTILFNCFGLKSASFYTDDLAANQKLKEATVQMTSEEGLNSFFVEKLNEKDSFLAGLGVDHHESMDKWFSKIKSGFNQGNFNQESLAKDFDNFRKDFDSLIPEAK